MCVCVYRYICVCVCLCLFVSVFDLSFKLKLPGGVLIQILVQNDLMKENQENTDTLYIVGTVDKSDPAYVVEPSGLIFHDQFATQDSQKDTCSSQQTARSATLHSISQEQWWLCFQRQCGIS